MSTGAPLSYVQYMGDGLTTDYAVPFRYLQKSHVDVMVDGESVPFVWITDSQIQLSSPAGEGLVVEIRRSTPRGDRLVFFSDGSTDTALIKNINADQTFFVVQEAFDYANATMAVTSDGSYSAQTRRIAEVGDPVNPQDVTTRSWVQGTYHDGKNAHQERLASEAARDLSEQYRNTAQEHRDAAAASASAASSSESNAASSEASAASSATSAGASKDKAQAWASQETGEVEPGLKSALQYAQDAQAAADSVDTARLVPTGVILMWSGTISTIPEGWALCDGTNGTPDLRNRFIVGAGASYAEGATGGATSKTTSTDGAHTHSISVSVGGHTLALSRIPSHSHSYVRGAGTWNTSGGSDSDASAGNRKANSYNSASAGSSYSHSHSGSGSSGSAGGHSHTVNVVPPYYALALIMKL